MMYKLFVLNLLVVIFGGSLLVYLSYIDPWLNPPIVMNVDQMRLQTDKAIYQRGDTVHIYSDFCKKRDSQAEVAWSLIDTVKLLYPSQSFNVPAGCYSGWFPVATIPTLVDDGVFHLEATTVVRVNNYATVTYNYKTEDFRIE